MLGLYLLDAAERVARGRDQLQMVRADFNAVQPLRDTYFPDYPKRRLIIQQPFHDLGAGADSQYWPDFRVLFLKLPQELRHEICSRRTGRRHNYFTAYPTAQRFRRTTKRFWFRPMTRCCLRVQ